MRRDAGKQWRGNQSGRRTDGPCYRCGYTGHLARDLKCPARGKTCNKCKQVGHFESVCKTKESSSDKGHKKSKRTDRKRDDVRQVSQDTEICSDSGYAFVVDGENSEFHDGKIAVDIGDVPLTVLIDSGATCNMVDRNTWNDLKEQGIKCVSHKNSKEMYPYGTQEPLPIAGTFTADIKL